MGVPAGCEEKIFEKFYRAHDSLSSGIQGSGLGLTLARQIARWSKQYQASETEPIDAMHRLIEWLPQHMPAETDEHAGQRVSGQG